MKEMLPRSLRRLSNKLATFFELLQNPDRFRVYLCNRFPTLTATSALVRWLYPAWRKYQFYRWTFRFIGSETAKGRGQNRYLTRVPNNAGIGDQIVTCWSETYMLARKHGLTFAHHPFLRSFHSPDTDWESFLGFGEGEAQAGEVLSDRNLKQVYVPPLLLTSPQNHLILSRLIKTVYPQDNIVFHLGSGVYLKSDIEQGEVMPAVYRQKYRAARRRFPFKTDFGPACLKAAVHVRRGDLALLKDNAEVHWEKRWIDLGYYVNLLGDLIEALPAHGTQVRVFSDGSADELAELAALPNVELRLGESPLQAFHDMVAADILVVSTSAFSICAGKISDGVKLFGSNFDSDDFRLFIPEAEDWVQAEASGHLSIDTQCRIAERLGRRAVRGEFAGR